MKKKLIVFGVLLLVLIGGFYLYKNIDINKDKDNIIEDDSKDIVDSEEVSDDLFGKYYNEANEYLENMTIEEKIGQLFLVRYDQNLVDSYIENYNAGGFILFANDFKDHTKSSILNEINKHQNNSSIPLTIAVDEEGGYVTRISRYSAFRDSKFLSPKDYYEKGGYELLEEMENEKASLLKSIGINLNLAPVADISTDENDFIYNRSFGYDANKTKQFISNMVTYANNNNISSCLKHFPGYGNNVDTHTGGAIDERSYDTFEKSDYLPFIGGIESGVPFILVSHNIVKCMDDTYPASLSKKVITGELRNKLKFSGIVITDDLDMEAVSEYRNSGTAATYAINAGADMIITSDIKNMYNELLDAVSNKTISEDKIDMAVKRIISWKLAYKLM